MSRTYLLTLSIFAASKPRADATEHMPFKDYDGFAAVSGLSTPPEGTTAGSQLAAIGWNSYEELNRRVLIRIELPDEVLVGSYQIANVTRHGLHASEKSDVLHVMAWEALSTHTSANLPVLERQVVMRRPLMPPFALDCFFPSRKRLAPDARLR